MSATTRLAQGSEIEGASIEKRREQLLVEDYMCVSRVTNNNKKVDLIFNMADALASSCHRRPDANYVRASILCGSTALVSVVFIKLLYLYRRQLDVL